MTTEELIEQWEELKLFKFKVRSEVRKELRAKESEIVADRVREKEIEFANALIEAPLTVTEKQKILGTRTWSVYKHYLNLTGREVNSPRVQEEEPQTPLFELVGYSVPEMQVEIRDTQDDSHLVWKAVYFGGLTFEYQGEDSPISVAVFESWLKENHLDVWEQFNELV